MPLEDMDVALIDLGDPWIVIPQVRKMLKGSGSIFAICPTMNQLEKLTMALVENEFTDIESTEHIIRNIEAREGKCNKTFIPRNWSYYLSLFCKKSIFWQICENQLKNQKLLKLRKSCPHKQ